MDGKEIDLIPIGIKNQIRMIKIVSTCTELCAITLLVIMCATGFFRDLITGLVFSFVLLVITTPLLIPGYVFDKISQSTVRFSAEHIYILDKKGRCWRTIDCSVITAVSEKEITGFFYGKNKDTFRNKYVCIFLNGTTNIPDVPYKKLFNQKDFIMFAYHAEALQWLLQKEKKTLNISVNEWLDRETKEANLLVCDKDIRFTAFCPHYVGLDSQKIMLQSLYTNDIILTFDKPMIKKVDDGFYSYIVVAKVSSITPPCVELTDAITIELDSALPGDIQKGQNVQFYTERLSLD